MEQETERGQCGCICYASRAYHHVRHASSPIDTTRDVISISGDVMDRLFKSTDYWQSCVTCTRSKRIMHRSYRPMQKHSDTVSDVTNRTIIHRKYIKFVFNIVYMQNLPNQSCHSLSNFTHPLPSIIYFPIHVIHLSCLGSEQPHARFTRPISRTKILFLY